MLSYKNFMKLCEQSPAELNRPKLYLYQHSLRFYETYKTARRLLRNEGSILSIGAGRAFVEYALSEEINADVSVFDFLTETERNKDQYGVHGFNIYSGNLMTDLSILEGRKYDLVLYCEIVEHIPIDPKIQFEMISKFIKPDGRLIVSTPNIASLANAINLLRGRNIIATAEKLFSPESKAAGLVHQREYTLSEMCAAMRDAKLDVVSARHIQQQPPRMRPLSPLLYGISSMVSPLRPMMIFVGSRS